MSIRNHKLREQKKKINTDSLNTHVFHCFTGAHFIFISPTAQAP